MKLLAVIFLLPMGACANDAFTAAPLTVQADTGPPDAPSSSVDGRGELAEATTPAPEAGTRDVLGDAWPEDVTIESVDAPPTGDGTGGDPMCTFGGTPATGCPCVNCYIFDGPNGTVDHISCCDGSGDPPDSATDHLCSQGDFPTPHKGYCSTCGCR